MKRKSGFTLIELVVVIVILGILAVTAAPRFLNIQDDARKARLEGMKGAIASALAIGYGKMATAGLESVPYVSNKKTAYPATNLPFDGCKTSDSMQCTFLYGYPDADDHTIGLLIQGINESSNSDWKTFHHKAGSFTREMVIAPRDDPRASLTQCGILYGPPMSKNKSYKLEILPCPK